MGKAIWIAIILGTILIGGLTVTLIFRSQSLAPQPQRYTLIIEAHEGGTTDPEPNTHTYEQGVNVTIREIPNSDHRFGHWRLDETDLTEPSETITVTMNRNHTVEVFFRPPEPEPLRTYTLTVHVSPSEGGWVMIETPLGDANLPQGNYNFTDGLTITLYELPNFNLGYQFVNWQVLELGSGNEGSLETDSVDIAMTQNIDITAFFELIPPETHIVVIATTEGGTTNPAPGTYSYIDGTSLTVTAIPQPDYIFDGWEVNLASTNYTSPMTLTITEETLIVAYFTMKHTYTYEAKMSINEGILLVDARTDSFFDVFVNVTACYKFIDMHGESYYEETTVTLHYTEPAISDGYKYAKGYFNDGEAVYCMKFTIFNADGIIGGKEIPEPDTDFVKYLSDEYFKLM